MNYDKIICSIIVLLNFQLAIAYLHKYVEIKLQKNSCWRFPVFEGLKRLMSVSYSCKQLHQSRMVLSSASNTVLASCAIEDKDPFSRLLFS